jgi:hypothetical protein
MWYQSLRCEVLINHINDYSARGRFLMPVATIRQSTVTQ